jgi:hypothetical protein
MIPDRTSFQIPSNQFFQKVQPLQLKNFSLFLKINDPSFQLFVGVIRSFFGK